VVTQFFEGLTTTGKLRENSQRYLKIFMLSQLK